MLNFWKNFKDKYYLNNDFFSIQFLFTWLCFKILGMLHILFWFKFLLCFVLFFVLFHYWEPILGWILNNVIFQYYIYSVMCFINIIYFFKLAVPILFFLVAFCYSYNNFNSIFLEKFDLVFLMPSLQFFFIFLTSIVFLYKLCKKVVYVAFSKAFVWQLKVPVRFDWSVFIDLLNYYFQERVLIKNKITVFKLDKKPLLCYPISAYYFEFLLDFNETNFVGLLSEKFESGESEEDIAKWITQFLSDREVKLKTCSEDLHKMNDLFFFNIAIAWFLAFFSSFILLNLNTLLYLFSLDL